MSRNLVAVLISFSAVVSTDHRVYGSYLPTWDSLDTRPLPQWYDDAKVGIFIHWGVFSVPSFGSEWFWHKWKDSNDENIVNFMTKNYPPQFTYQDFARDFSAEFFNADKWAQLLARSGARYVVLTSKHHEGYTLWPSKYSFSWNAKDVGPHRDLVGELSRAIRQHTDLKFGLYHSLYEWYNPLWITDKNNSLKTNKFVQSKILPEMKELVETYAPDVLWSDGDWEAPDTYWESTYFLAWLYNLSPVRDTVVTNDRWGRNVQCKHGDFFTCEDRYNPGLLQKHKWENCFTIDKQSWGYRRNIKLDDIMSFEEIIQQLVTTVSCGGNVLINVGPTKEGTITPIFEERLRQMGDWLHINGEAIYSSRPWTYQNETNGIWYTRRKNYVYGIMLNSPTSMFLSLKYPQLASDGNVEILGYDGHIKFHITESDIAILLPDERKVHAPQPWVLKFTGVVNL